MRDPGRDLTGGTWESREDRLKGRLPGENALLELGR